MSIHTALRSAVFQSLEEQIAVIDRHGAIIDTNLSWQRFGNSNGLSPAYTCTGNNYLHVLDKAAASGDPLSTTALEGIREVMSGTRDAFQCEYPCHSPDAQRWFIMRITPVQGDTAGSYFVISHHDITARKIAEMKVERLAMEDVLTGLSNRRAFHDFLAREIRINTRQRTPLSLILVDVDYFKHYNDTLGHAAGDECLASIAQTLRNHARRPNDLAARIGGDEFALVLGDTSLKNATDIAVAVSNSVNSLDLFFEENRKVTASIGIATLTPRSEHDDDILFQQADQALYAAKESGRNQVVQASCQLKIAASD